MKRVRSRSFLLTAIAFLTGSTFFVFGAGSSGASAAPSVSSWQQSVRALPLSGSGCFSASFPVLQWRSVACQEAPAVPFAPTRGDAAPAAVGDGVDYSALSSGAPFTSVTGSFPSVSAGITENGAIAGPGSPSKANTYSLQLNTSFFSPATVCASAKKPSKCRAWQQFILSTSSDANDPPEIFMQYWLIHYAAACPSGWFSYLKDCYTNSNATSVPAVTAAGLANVSLEGSVAAHGNDKTILTSGTHVYAVSNSDSEVGLASSWTAAEFGIFGDGDGSQADFGAGTTLVVRTATDGGTGPAPSCSDADAGTTGETNNLNLVKTPAKDAGSGSAIVSKQSNAVSSAASCVSG